MSKREKAGGPLRVRILNTAGQFFKQHGYEKTTYQMIADELKISKGSISYHFRNKTWIVYAFFERIMLAARAFVRDNLGEEDKNAYLSNCITQIIFYRSILSDELERSLFFHIEHISLWEKESLHIIKGYFFEIADDFHRGMTEEDIHVAAIMSLGAKMGMFREAVRFEGPQDIDKLCYYFVFMVGLFSRLDVMTIETNIRKAFEFLEGHPFNG
jgi:AcrR family transcriptional regulator